MKAGSAYFDKSGRTSQFDKNHLIRNFSEMPTFLSGDIASACAVMYRYLGLKSHGSKLGLLIKRTSELVAGLEAVGKLKRAPGDADPIVRNNIFCDQAIQHLPE